MLGKPTLLKLILQAKLLFLNNLYVGEKIQSWKKYKDKQKCVKCWSRSFKKKVCKYSYDKNALNTTFLNKH